MNNQVACFKGCERSAFTKVLSMTTASTSNEVLRCFAWVYNPTEPFVPPKGAFVLLKSLVSLDEVGFGVTLERSLEDPGSASILTLAAFFASIAAEHLKMASPPLLPSTVHNQFCAHFGRAADTSRIKQVNLGLQLPLPPPTQCACWSRSPCIWPIDSLTHPLAHSSYAPTVDFVRGTTVTACIRSVPHAVLDNITDNLRSLLEQLQDVHIVYAFTRNANGEESFDGPSLVIDNIHEFDAGECTCGDPGTKCPNVVGTGATARFPMEVCCAITAGGVLANVTAFLAAAYRLAVLKWRQDVAQRNKSPAMDDPPPPPFNPNNSDEGTTSELSTASHSDGADSNGDTAESKGNPSPAPPSTGKPANTYKRGISEDAPLWNWFDWQLSDDVMAKYLLDPELSAEQRKEVEVAAVALVDTHAFFYFPTSFHQDASFARWPEAYGVFNLISAWFATIGAIETGYASRWIHMVLDHVHDQFPNPSNVPTTLASKFAPCRPRTMLKLLLADPLSRESFAAVCGTKQEGTQDQVRLPWHPRYEADAVLQLSVGLGLHWKREVEVPVLARLLPTDAGMDTAGDVYVLRGANKRTQNARVGANE